MSVSRPERVVVTRDIAVSPTTTKGEKFLYATDLRQGSLMHFDISLDSSDRTPLLRPHAVLNPLPTTGSVGVFGARSGGRVRAAR